MATPAQHGSRHRYRQPPARVPDWATSRPVYRPRRPTSTPLYPVVHHHLETFLAQATQADPMGCGVPAWVERDLRAYLRCGILAHGFARAKCEDCGHERLIPFSCKGRGVCPSCNTRRMAEVAAHITDHVLPHLPVRRAPRTNLWCAAFALPGLWWPNEDPRISHRPADRLRYPPPPRATPRTSADLAGSRTSSGRLPSR